MLHREAQRSILSAWRMSAFTKQLRLLALTSSPQLSKQAFKEAERTWGRTVAEFDSREAFVQKFEQAYRLALG
jgi:hypothetical protein